LRLPEYPYLDEITYGQSIEDSVITGGVAKSGDTVISGTFFITNHDDVPETGLQPVFGVFVPTDDNYSSVSFNIGITVFPKVLSLSKNSQTTYNGQYQDLNISVVGIVLNDSADYTVTYGYDNKVFESGTYLVTFIVNDANYEAEQDQYYFNVLKKDVIVTADAVTKIYGEDDPEFTYNQNGLVNNDEFSGKLGRDPGENVGEYNIIPGNLSATDYNIILVPAKLTIEKKILTVSAQNKEKFFGESDPALTYTVSGLIGSDTVTGSLVRANGNDIGIYDINQGSVLGSDNYELVFVKGTFTIKPNTDCDIITIISPQGAFLSGNNITLSVPNGTASINSIDFQLSPYADYIIYSDSAKTIELNGTFNLIVGENIVYIVVTAQDDVTVKNYTLTVTRAGSSAKDVTPLIDSVSKEGTTITAETDEENINLGNLIVVSQGASYRVYSDEAMTQEVTEDLNLRKGDNTYYVEVTAEDGSTQVYTFTIVRATPQEVILYFVLTMIGIILVFIGLIIFKRYGEKIAGLFKKSKQE